MDICEDNLPFFEHFESTPKKVPEYDEEPQNTHKFKFKKIMRRTKKKNSWNKLQDQILIKLVKELGARNWTKISEKIKSRCGKQCRERWYNHLKEGVSKEQWDINEEWLLFLCVKAYSNKWARISKFLSGRTDNAIKNHWNCKIKRRIPQFEAKLTEILSNKLIGITQIFDEKQEKIIKHIIENSSINKQLQCQLKLLNAIETFLQFKRQLNNEFPDYDNSEKFENSEQELNEYIQSVFF